ncbi:MAG: Maf family protein, partial [Candidatus Omnitrophica bacterium]|nr:Maf family protein [Candidatus Omnitrophota bacterium]
PIILASQSKRRSAILTSCGIAHTVMPSDAKEIHPKKKHIISSVIKNAERKVRSVMNEPGLRDAAVIVIGADTLVTLGNEVIGKPRDSRHARAMLRQFSGASIDVYTGLFVINTRTQKNTSGFAKSTLNVKRIPEHHIAHYFEKLGSFDKAGGFSIEGVGSLIFDDIHGSYFNILGLPMERLSDLFEAIGHSLLDFCVV